MNWCQAEHPGLGACSDPDGHDGPHSTDVIGGTCWWGDSPEGPEDYEFTRNRCVEVSNPFNKYAIRLNMRTQPTGPSDE